MKTRMQCTAAFVLILLASCATEWRTDAPVKPTTYAASGPVSAGSVGRLPRLVVTKVTLHREAEEAEQATPEWQARNATIRNELRQEIVRYLVEQKGYEVRSIDEPPPGDEQAVRAAGIRLGVDGIVNVEHRLTKPWSTGQAISNIFLLNIPLLNALNAVNLRITIHETATGRTVWMKEMKGEMPDSPKSTPDVKGALGDLENALPAQLRR